MLGALGLLLAADSSAHGRQGVTLAWDANPEPDIAGYILYYGTTSRGYHSSINVGNMTNATVSTLTEGQTYYLAVTAVNSAGLESEPSNEISYAVPQGSTGILTEWRQQQFSAADLADPAKETTVWGEQADPDQDGRDNLFEFALGFDPNKGDASEDGIQTRVIEDDGQKHLNLVFRRRKNDLSLAYIPQVSGDKQTWYSGIEFVQEISLSNLTTEFDVVTFQDLAQVMVASPRFIRLKVTRTQP